MTIDVFALYLIISQYCLFSPFTCFCFIFVLGQKKILTFSLFSARVPFVFDCAKAERKPKEADGDNKRYFLNVCFLFI